MKIPVYITTNGRWEMLHRCVESMRRFPELGPITVVDNTGGMVAMDGVEIVHADNTYRHLAPWALEIVPKDRPYIVTDEDCAITDDCPEDVVNQMVVTLMKLSDVMKVGLGINTANFLDPAPERYRYSYEMERSVARRPMRGRGVRDAPVDTTFALYREGGEWPGICGVRLEAPYLIEHLPWLNEDYTDEEREYYRQEGMAIWARTHSAASEAPPKVLVPFTALRSETIVALANSDVAYEMVARPIVDDEGYFEALAEAWTPTAEHMAEPFIVVEHDIVVRPETLRELRDCPEDWCSAPYPYLDKERAWGMGCVKFSDRLIVRNPWIFSDMSHWSDESHPPKHWCRMDSRIWIMLTERGEKRHDHDGPALGHVGHPGQNSSAHGCVQVP